MCAVFSLVWRVKHLPNVSGTGALKDTLLSSLYINFLLLTSEVVFVQNGRDLSLGLFFKKKMVLLPGSGVNISKFKKVESKTNKLVEFIFVGRLIEEKGFRLVLRAFQKLRHNNFCAKLTIVGDDRFSQKRQDLSELSDCNDKYFQWVRWTTQPEIFFEKADCFVLPSVYGEGIPRSLLEALAFGHACIVSNERGLTDAVSNFKNGIVLESNSIDELYNAMKFMILNRKKLDEFKKASRVLAENKFDQQIPIAIYRKILNN